METEGLYSPFSAGQLSINQPAGPAKAGHYDGLIPTNVRLLATDTRQMDCTDPRQTDRTDTR